MLSLQTVGPQRDQIIIAMIEPNETLQIPILDFCVQKRFQELENQKLHGFPDPAHIAFALMDIRLRLDETGADFLSVGEVGVVGENGHTHYNADRIRRFVLHRPFFIALKEPKGSEPYFMGWIANSELMELVR